MEPSFLNSVYPVPPATCSSAAVPWAQAAPPRGPTVPPEAIAMPGELLPSHCTP